ncbi:MAG: type II secretion system F family protein [Pirellulales bacterium]|nr:type II secretion system F family protein [Pirellulales bacterium]
MPEFSYVARDNAGAKVSGTLTADGQHEVMAALAHQALFPLEVRLDSPVMQNERVGRVPAQVMATTYGQMADLLHSGVPLLRALEVLQRQSSHARLSHVLGQIHRQVEDGATLAEAMGRFDRVFSEMAVSMIRAGGEGGFLEEALSRVAEFTEAQEDLKRRTIGAVVYPAVLAGVGCTVVTVLIVFFVPKFEDLFVRLRERGELPFLTDWLLWTSGELWRWGWLVLGTILAGGWYVRHWLRSRRGRDWSDRMKLRLPVVGVVFLNLAVSRFCRVLGTLLRNGVPILRALEISSDASANSELAAAIHEATENISAGQTLAEPLAESKRFPPTVIEMIAVAEQSNNLENVLLDIADGLERRTWRRLDLAVRMIEPVLLAMLASAVLVVVVALLLPLLRMHSTF